MGLIKNHLKKMATNAIGGKLGSLLDGAFNAKISGSAASLGKNMARLKAQANHVFEENEYSFGALSFPSDLASESTSNGHYMIFYINVPEEEEANDQARGRVMGKDLGSVESQLNSGEIRGLNQAVLGRKQRKRTTNVISLYMPAEISATYGVNYNREDIGTATRVMDQGFLETMFGKEQVSGLMQQVKGDAVDMVAPGFKAALQSKTGRAINNRLEMTFGGVNPREFTYNFKFTPSNEQEANDIQSILYLFKYHMHPTIVGEPSSSLMRVPSSFNIHYMYRTDENKYLNTIAESVLINLDVKYGEGDTFKTYRGNTAGAPPRTINATLTFNEIDTHDKKTIFELELPPSRSGSTTPSPTQSSGAGAMSDAQRQAGSYGGSDIRRPDVL
jgi:hypothetical protein